jgi:hypothetical protein
MLHMQHEVVQALNQVHGPSRGEVSRARPQKAGRVTPCAPFVAAKRIAESLASFYSHACPKPKQAERRSPNRPGFGFRKNKNDQKNNLTKIISRSFGCGSH